MTTDVPDPDRPGADRPEYAGPPPQPAPQGDVGQASEPAPHDDAGHPPEPAVHEDVERLAESEPHGDAGPAPEQLPMVTGAAPPTEPASGRRGFAGIAAAAATVVVITLLGALLGLLWLLLAPSTPVVKAEQGAIPTDPEPEQFIAADGWFTLLGLGSGVLVAIAVWFVLRRYRGPVGLVSVALGSVGAGCVAWWLGHAISRSEYHRLRGSVAVGETFDLPPALRAGDFEWIAGIIPTPHGVLLLPAFGAVVTYTLLAGWSRYPSLHPEPEPTLASWDSTAPHTPTPAPGPPVPDAAESPRD